MKHFACSLPMVLVLVGLLGCGAPRAAEEGGGMPAEDGPTTGKAEPTAIATSPVPIQVGGTVFDPSIEAPELLVISDLATWNGLWARLHRQVSPAPRTVDIDFDEHQVLALLDRQRNTGGYAVRFERVQRQDDRLIVEASAVSPNPQAMVTMALTQPVAVVCIPRQPDGVTTELRLEQVVQGKP